MRKKLFIAIYCSGLMQLPCSAQNLQWAKSMAGTGNDYSFSITLDAAGNVYTVGAFIGTVDFDPDPALTYTLTSAGSADIFISKFDAAGNFIWAKGIGGTFQDQGRSITTDDSGNVYYSGYFQLTADFNPDPAVTFNLTAVGGGDIFISKLDASGKFIWVKQMIGNGFDISSFITLDNTGNIHTTGDYNGTVDFDPDLFDTMELTSTGSYDIFVSKLDPAGNFTWAKTMGGTAPDYSGSIAIDDSGNAYFTGYFQGTADFDADSGGILNLTSAGGFDIFVSKINSSGNLVWAKNMGGTGADFGYRLAIDDSGNVYVSGRYELKADFNPDPADSFNLTAAGPYDIFISKLNSSGNFIWAKSMGGSGGDGGYAIATDDSGNVYTSGGFENTSDFDPDPADTFNLTSSGGKDIFISKLNSSGIFIWAKRMGGVIYDALTAITLDDSKNIFLTGYFEGTADFDPAPTDTFNLTSSGGYDIFVCKLSSSPCNTVNTPAAAEICSGDSAFLQGNYQTSQGIYYDTLVSSGGCDSVISTMLTVHPVYNVPVTAEICSGDSIFLQGSYRKTAGTYYNILATVNGCDSVIATTLTVHPAYNFPAAAEICSGDSVLLQGSYRKMAGTYYDIFSTGYGCDSVIATTLTVHPLPVVSLGNDTVICPTCSLTLDAGNPGAAYLWSTSAATQTIIVNVTGVYYVVLTDMDGCSGSDTIMVTVSTGITSSGGQTVLVYPVPAGDKICITGNTVPLSVQLQSVTGQVVYNDGLKTPGELDISLLPAGIYLLSLSGEEIRLYLKIVKQ